MKSSPIMTMQLSFYVAFAVVVVSVCVNRVTGYLPVDAYDNGHVGKKGSPRYADYGLLDAPPSSCTREADYEISQNYIIRTKDSKQNGANFVAALSVRTFDVCLEQCCLKENCDTTIFVGEAYRSEETNCFLFVCRPEGKYGDNRCLFTYHLGYISSMKKALGGFQGYAPDPITTAIPVQQIETTTKPTPPPKQFPPIEPVSNCPEGYFECDSGQCINELYICNSVLDCDDGTDEYGCNPQEPPPAEKTNADQDTFTEDQKLPQSHLIPPTNPPNIPNKYFADAEPGPSIKGEADQTLADQLNDQSPLENVDKSTSSMQDPNQNNREKELSDMKLRVQDESRGRLPEVLDNQEPDEDENQDQFPELECHGTTCFEIQPDGGKTRFGGILDEEQDEEVERERVDEKENLKPRPENQQKSPVDTHQRNLEREEYQTGDLRDDDENYQGPQRAKLPDYKEDAAKFLYDKSTGEYRLDEDESNTKYDVSGKGDETDQQRDDEGKGGRYLDDKHLSDVEDRDASEQRGLDYDPIDRKIISDHDVGMKHPADVQSTRNDAHGDGDADRQDRPPLRDGNKNRGFSNNPLKPRPPTQPPVRQGISNSEPHLGAGYGYNSDYYSYYYQPYGQTQDRYRSQQTQNSKWQFDRSRQDSYGGRHSQVASNYQSKNNPHRVPETQYDDRSRYGTNTDVYSNNRYHKVSDMTSDHRKNQRPVDDVQTRPRYNTPVPIDENAPQSVEVVTVVAPPNEAVTDGKAQDDGKANETNVLTQQDSPNVPEMVPESHGGSGMPPASSAILPLVIGLVITVCLLMMVGCRLRYMNQRLRYGRLKTSAHDADYLINGMYL
ncbi:uncharacterized protein LOC121418905 isoform X2 [Lytechinus variegatus]|uniref:uncharacterized protein LOC121418905 isoform X2 n=1 Tax=Lytechinus variegatus TaxID=7654 RepID=UPI001BB1153D|nr:uncharacterized protein LOC121418905 isoform X2 [Lytechinus variegatus]